MKKQVGRDSDLKVEEKLNLNIDITGSCRAGAEHRRSSTSGSSSFRHDDLPSQPQADDLHYVI